MHTITASLTCVEELRELLRAISLCEGEAPQKLYDRSLCKAEEIVALLHDIQPQPIAVEQPVVEPMQIATPIPPIVESVVELPPAIPAPLVEVKEEIPVIQEAQPVVAETATHQPLTLDHALQRRIAKDIRKAINLNDRFRFRRELFGNNDALMNETLDMINAQESYATTLEKLHAQFSWEAESETVLYFLSMVENRFL